MIQAGDRDYSRSSAIRSRPWRFIVGFIYIVIGKVSREAAFMIADVADALTDQNSRYEKQI